jgi:hypothetical protein
MFDVLFCHSILIKLKILLLKKRILNSKFFLLYLKTFSLFFWKRIFFIFLFLKIQISQKKG